MSNKEIENWKGQADNGKTIFVATKVKTIHPVVDAIVKNLCEIDLIQYVRISQEDIQASNEIEIKGRIKIPISTTGHPSAAGIHLRQLDKNNHPKQSVLLPPRWSILP
jgi:hypothetical protein